MDKLAFKTWLESLPPDHRFEGMYLSTSCPLASWLTSIHNEECGVVKTSYRIGRGAQVRNYRLLDEWANNFRREYDMHVSRGTPLDALRVLESLSTPEIVS